MNPLLADERLELSWGGRVGLWVRSLKIVLELVFVTFMQKVPGRVQKRNIDKQIAAGKTIWLDDLALPFKLPPEQLSRDNPLMVTDMTPNTHLRPRKSRIIQIDEYPDTNYPFSYRQPPRSGNEINGLGETGIRSAYKVFHSVSYRVAWGGLERFFHLSANEITLKLVNQIRWADRSRGGRPAARRIEVADLDQMADFVKQAGIELGAGLVGITGLSVTDGFAHFDTTSYPTAISLVVPMDLEGIRNATSVRASEAIMGGYLQVTRASAELARRIRGMGYRALAASNLGEDTSEILHLPIAVRAGLGQLGKHGSIITKAFGSNVRLATVLTDLPVAHDEPEDIGVDDFCLRCQICTTNCPPQAIFDEKQLVRGVEKWYVDFDKCVPYFAMNNSCGICVAVCPWSEPGRGEAISLKMMAQRLETKDE